MNTATPPNAPPTDIACILADFDSSGQSTAAFARSRGIAVWRLRYALARREGRPRAAAARRQAPRPTFVPVELVDSIAPTPPAPLELLLASGHRVQIRGDFDPKLLRRVVEALARC
jgi:hypothetical protein